MKDFQILTDAVADLPQQIKSLDYITVIPTPIIISGVHNITITDLSPDDFGEVERFIKQGDRATTSQPQVFDPYRESFNSVETTTRRLVEQGKDVVYITMNSSLSGTFSSVSLCYAELEDWAKEQGRTVRCVDSRCMSTGLALLFLELVEAINHNDVKNVNDIVNFVEKERGHIGHFFTWGELSYIKLSGRVSSVKATLGTLLGVRLIGSAQYVNGGTERKLEHVNPGAMIRSLAKFGDVIGIYAQKHISNPHGPIIVAHGNVPRDAALVKERMQRYLPNANFLIGHDWRCGAGIQIHGGPTSLHINFRTDNIGDLETTTEEMETIIRKMRKK